MAPTHSTKSPHHPLESSSPKQTPGLRLILVRHGESWSNVDDLIAGEHTCRGLTERGRCQARAAAEHLAIEQSRLGVSMVYSTAVPRAVETAELIAHRLDVPMLADFPYQKHGTAEGHSRHAIEPTHAHLLDSSPDYPLATGADSWASAAHRVGRALDALTTRHPHGTIVLTCHRETILAAAQHFQRIPPTLTYASAEVGYTAITEWEHRPRTRNPQHWRWILVRHNDTRHLPLSMTTKCQP
nr:histidine phosphatase family protein [Nocardia terpenica]